MSMSEFESNALLPQLEQMLGEEFERTTPDAVHGVTEWVGHIFVVRYLDPTAKWEVAIMLESGEVAAREETLALAVSALRREAAATLSALSSALHALMCAHPPTPPLPEPR